MLNKPLVSVIMNCFNSDTFLREAIDSVYAQTFSEWEIIFYDNHSSDQSAEIAQSYNEKLRYLSRENTIPLGEARNAAIAQAKGKYLAFLDCDDIWEADKLQQLIPAAEAAIERGRNIGLIYSDAMRINKTGESLIPYSFERKLYSGDIYHALVSDCFMAMSAVVVLRKAFYAAGEFDAGYSFVEDWALWVEIARRYEALLVPGLHTQIRIHDSNESRKSLAHVKEKIDWITSVKSDDPVINKRCNKLLKVLRWQHSCLRVVASRRTYSFQLIKNIVHFIAYSLSHPIVFVKMGMKYLTPSMLYFMKRKFL